MDNTYNNIMSTDIRWLLILVLFLFEYWDHNYYNMCMNTGIYLIIISCSCSYSWYLLTTCVNSYICWLNVLIHACIWLCYIQEKDFHINLFYTSNKNIYKMNVDVWISGEKSNGTRQGWDKARKDMMQSTGNYWSLIPTLSH